MFQNNQSQWEKLLRDLPLGLKEFQPAIFKGVQYL